MSARATAAAAPQPGCGPLACPPPPPRLVPVTPIALFLREHGDVWLTMTSDSACEREGVLSDEGRTVLHALRSRGPSFLPDLGAATGLDPDALRSAIGALVASGLVVSDGFAGLRALVRAARGLPPIRDRRATFAGRWTAVDVPVTRQTREDAIEAQAWTLLRRYGVVCRRILARETAACPWRDLVRFYRRLEARGEIRGGRFVHGMSGEQFALPDAIQTLREVRRSREIGTLVTISAADPLNLAGIVTAGERIRVAGRTRIVYRDGIPIAVRERDYVRPLVGDPDVLSADVLSALAPRGRGVWLAKTGAVRPA